MIGFIKNEEKKRDFKQKNDENPKSCSDNINYRRITVVPLLHKED